MFRTMTSRLVRRTPLTIGCLVLAIASVDSRAAHTTFDLRVRAYCHTANCDFTDLGEFRRFLLDQIQEANKVWQRAGFSFRPAGGDLVNFLDYNHESYFSTIGPIEGNESKIAQLRNLALQEPGLVTLFLIEDIELCFSAIPPGETGLLRYGVFCGPKSPGQTFAHEFGHHFCLVHPFTWQDPADNSPLSHDLDGFQDTPDDPGEFETPRRHGGAGADSLDPGRTQILDGHEWCEWAFFQPTLTMPIPTWPTDPGSHRPEHCETVCLRTSGGVATSTSFAPLASNVMSYYGGNCMGPYVLGGRPFYAFSDEQVARVEWCVEAIPERDDLPQACIFGDLDSDGLCDLEDGCPAVPDTAQRDRDGDGVPDACDLCADDPNPSGDIDHDGIGDACDDDRDNDGCPNQVDQHPDQREVVIGTRFNVNCSTATEPRYGFEGFDSDEDGQRDCEDLDDDNDGVPDVDDPCPTRGDDICIFPGRSCPDLPWLDVCSLGTSCVEYLVKIVQVINPDPSREKIFERFAIFNDHIYLFPPAAETLTESAAALLGGSLCPDCSGAADAATDAAGPLRMEVWSRRTHEPVTTLVEYEPAEVELGDVYQGEYLAVRVPDADGGTMAAAGAWAIGAEPGLPLADIDRDGVPDANDNCLRIGNQRQRDADADGFGDRCDADLDGDGVVTRADLDTFAWCDGADLDYYVPIVESDDSLSPRPDRELADKKLRCRSADLTGDRRVNTDDLLAARGRLGRPPGPAGSQLPPPLANYPPVAEPGPDRVLECEGDGRSEASLDGSASSDFDSTPGTNDDVVRFVWSDGDSMLAEDVYAQVMFDLGTHPVTLAVTDRAGVTDSETIRVDVRDTIAPRGAITFPSSGECLGGDALPVVVADSFADDCDPALSRAYDPPAGPGYSAHGDYDVTVTATDRSGNESADRVVFTIDDRPPEVTIFDSRDPVVLPTLVPFQDLFAASDEDGARGGVIHEWIAVDGCVVYDGDAYGNRDGRLSDESVPVGEDTLCRLVEVCGQRAWSEPRVTVTASDCGGNATTASITGLGRIEVTPERCP